ncbi:hypothetical protein BST16_15425 [Mycobacterium asiaticum DSM 44297]|nr:hypothetical protein BST16_15425 [Mycobacterium asiaticum DSM 44297]
MCPSGWYRNDAQRVLPKYIIRFIRPFASLFTFQMPGQLRIGYGHECVAPRNLAGVTRPLRPVRGASVRIRRRCAERW